MRDETKTLKKQSSSAFGHSGFVYLSNVNIFVQDVSSGYVWYMLYLNNHSHNALEGDDEEAQRALLRGRPHTVPEVQHV